VLGDGDRPPEAHVEQPPGLIERELAEGSAIGRVSGGEHDVIEFADAREQVGDGRLVADVEHGAVAGFREFGERGVAPSTAVLLADVGVAIFRTAFGRWVDEPDAGTLPNRLREAATELAAAFDSR